MAQLVLQESVGRRAFDVPGVDQAARYQRVSRELVSTDRTWFPDDGNRDPMCGKLSPKGVVKARAFTIDFGWRETDPRKGSI